MDARRQQLGPAVEQLVAEATHLGLGQDEIQALISERFQKLNRKAQIP
jgi:DNA-binding transcriptional regulator YhcF (GntR family)